MKVITNYLRNIYKNFQLSHLLILAILMILLGIFIQKDKTEQFENQQHKQEKVSKVVTENSGKQDVHEQCTKQCSENDNLLPIMNPLFNMRECVKQCILLEDHLFQTKKRCQDCIKKHFLTMEGLAEEAITLDKENKYQLDKLKLADQIRDIQKKYINKEDPVEVAQCLRQIRKPLMAKYFHNFE